MLVILPCADASTCAVGIGRYVSGLVCMCGVVEGKRRTTDRCTARRETRL
jgi:hypothetical protein